MTLTSCASSQITLKWHKNVQHMSGFELFRHFYKLIEYFFSRKCHLEFSSIISRLNSHITPLFIIIIIIIIIIITSIFGHLAHQRPSTPCSCVHQDLVSRLHSSCWMHKVVCSHPLYYNCSCLFKTDLRRNFYQARSRNFGVVSMSSCSGKK